MQQGGVSWRDTAWRSGEGNRSDCLILGRARIRDGAAGAVRFAFDFEDDRPIDQAVQEGHRQRWIAEVGAPGVEVDFLEGGIARIIAELPRGKPGLVVIEYNEVSPSHRGLP